jgi:hypothetical protein
LVTKLAKPSKPFFLVVGSTPTGCFPGGDTVVEPPTVFFGVLHCFVGFVII